MNDNPYTAHPARVGRLTSRTSNLAAVLRAVAGDTPVAGEDQLRRAAKLLQPAAEQAYAGLKNVHGRVEYGLMTASVIGDANPEGKAAARRRRQAERNAANQAARAARQEAERTLLLEMATVFDDMARLARFAADSMADMAGAINTLREAVGVTHRAMKNIAEFKEPQA